MDELDIGDAAGLFQEPDGYFQPEKEPTTVHHRTLDGRDLSLRLVGSSPLWGHLLWNAGRTVADYLEREQRTLVHGRRVLELGAGAGLPSLICALNGARHVVVTDYPDAELIANLEHNIARCPDVPQPANIEACGYLWEHAKLLRSVQNTLRQDEDARALVFFTPYRPWLLEKDLAFFDLARQGGFVVEKVLEKTMDRVMFDHDPGVSQPYAKPVPLTPAH